MPRANTIYDVLERLVICEPTTLETGCWEWRGEQRAGYGKVKIDRVSWLVHRLVYEHFVGNAPERLHHRCENPCCANFEHLEPVTAKKHREYHPDPKSKWTHCRKGHPLSGDNLYTAPYGSRICRECKKNWERENYRKKHGSVSLRNSDKTTCPQGHPYDEANTWVRKSGGRHCKACARAASKRHYWKKKANGGSEKPVHGSSTEG